MVRRITAAALILLAACGGSRMRQGSRTALSYAQLMSLEKGMPVDAVLRAFGEAADVREEKGTVRGLAYPCEDESGRVLQLRMAFSPEGALEDWALRDPAAPAPESRPRS